MKHIQVVENIPKYVYKKIYPGRSIRNAEKYFPFVMLIIQFYSCIVRSFKVSDLNYQINGIATKLSTYEPVNYHICN
jgi:hypothetical protein